MTKKKVLICAALSIYIHHINCAEKAYNTLTNEKRSIDEEVPKIRHSISDLNNQLNAQKKQLKEQQKALVEREKDLKNGEEKLNQAQEKVNKLTIMPPSVKKPLTTMLSDQKKLIVDLKATLKISDAGITDIITKIPPVTTNAENVQNDINHYMKILNDLYPVAQKTLKAAIEAENNVKNIVQSVKGYGESVKGYGETQINDLKKFGNTMKNLFTPRENKKG